MTQSLPIEERVETWLAAIREYFSKEWWERLFEVFDEGTLLPWEVARLG